VKYANEVVFDKSSQGYSGPGRRKGFEKTENNTRWMWRIGFLVIVITRIIFFATLKRTRLENGL
jgi:hypothetical protein